MGYPTFADRWLAQKCMKQAELKKQTGLKQHPQEINEWVMQGKKAGHAGGHEKRC